MSRSGFGIIAGSNGFSFFLLCLFSFFFFFSLAILIVWDCLNWGGVQHCSVISCIYGVV